jgi:hypothetical protein
MEVWVGLIKDNLSKQLKRWAKVESTPTSATIKDG